MELINFAEFAGRRAAQMSVRDNAAAADAPVFDRWADLHTERPAQEMIAARIIDIGATDFWYDLQFRLAYPTHRLRRH